MWKWYKVKPGSVSGTGQRAHIQLKKALFEAAVRVNAAEYQRLLNCLAIIENSLTDLEAGEDV